MKLPVQTINYFYLALAILWEPLQLAFLNIDAKARIIFVLTLTVMLINLLYDRKFLKLINSKPIIFWGLWVLYSIVNLQIQGYYGELSFLFYIVLQLWRPFLVMCIAAKETQRNARKLFQVLTVSFLIYGILSVTVLGGTGAQEERLIGELGNNGPLTVMFLIFFASLLYVNKWLNRKKLVPLLAFAFFVVAISGTRKAFGAALIMTGFLIFSQFSLRTKKILLVAVLGISLYFGYAYAMGNTILGERFEQGLEVGEKYNITNFKALNVLGDRVFFYIDAWEIFKDNPITGIGLKNYLQHSNVKITIHSEYMVQLAEGGIIGTFLFLLFNFWIGKNLLRFINIKGYHRATFFVLAGGFIAILFINLVAWTYEFSRYFIAFGVMIIYIKKIQNENSHTQYRKK